MVDVGVKSDTRRYAVASGRVLLGQRAFQAVETNSLAKGDVLSVARVAGIMAAKQTASLIPLCHALPLDKCAPVHHFAHELPGTVVFAVRKNAKILMLQWPSVSER